MTAGARNTIDIAKAPNAGSPKGVYAFSIYDGDLRGCVDIELKKDSGEIVALGLANGCMPINNTVAPGPCPLTFGAARAAETMSALKASLLCVHPLGSPKAPTTYFARFPVGKYTILSVHLDRSAPASPAKDVAIGDTIVVVAE